MEASAGLQSLPLSVCDSPSDWIGWDWTQSTNSGRRNNCVRSVRVGDSLAGFLYHCLCLIQVSSSRPNITSLDCFVLGQISARVLSALKRFPPSNLTRKPGNLTPHDKVGREMH